MSAKASDAFNDERATADHAHAVRVALRLEVEEACEAGLGAFARTARELELAYLRATGRGKLRASSAGALRARLAADHASLVRAHLRAHVACAEAAAWANAADGER